MLFSCGSALVVSNNRSYGVVVSTLDFESSDPSSNVGKTLMFFFRNEALFNSTSYEFGKLLDILTMRA